MWCIHNYSGNLFCVDKAQNYLNHRMNAQNPLWPEFFKALRQEVVPALGCTEPVSLALCCAIAAHHLGGTPERIEALVSANLMKNGMGVTVPGTGTTGLFIAAAVGALGGDPDAGLEVLHDLSAETVQAAQKMVGAGRVALDISDTPQILYSEATLVRGDEQVKVVIADSHTHVILIEKNGQVLFRNAPAGEEAPAYSLEGACAADVYDFALTVPFADIAFILSAQKLNQKLSDTGLVGNYGLQVGKTLQRNIARGFVSDDLFTTILMRTAAASDARMGGASLPAMTNSGSGNQGIAATMPVVVLSEHLGVDEETLARALILSHLMAVHIHAKLPRLSAFCAATTAAMGSASAMAWLLGGDFQTVGRAICNMIGDLAGVICDGASNSCAMKVSTSVASASKAVLMALDGLCVGGNEGIVADDVDQAIANLCALASGGMVKTDHQIIRIMMQKHA